MVASSLVSVKIPYFSEIPTRTLRPSKVPSPVPRWRAAGLPPAPSQASAPGGVRFKRAGVPRPSLREDLRDVTAHATVVGSTSPWEKEMMHPWICKLCGFVYDPWDEGKPFSALPDNYRCPVCRIVKDKGFAPFYGKVERDGHNKMESWLKAEAKKHLRL